MKTGLYEDLNTTSPLYLATCLPSITAASIVSLTSAAAAVTTTQVDQLPGYRPTTKVTPLSQQGEYCMIYEGI